MKLAVLLIVFKGIVHDELFREDEWQSVEINGVVHENNEERGERGSVFPILRKNVIVNTGGNSSDEFDFLTVEKVVIKPPL